MAQKQYLIRVNRLASEKTIAELAALHPDWNIPLPTDQNNGFAYYILPDSVDAPDLAMLYTPLRAGLSRYLGLLSAWTADCAGTPPPPPAADAPTFVAGWTPPSWTPGADYYVELNTDDATLITPATGQTVTGFSAPVLPPFLHLTAAYQQPKKFFISGSIPVGTTSLNYTLQAVGSNGKTVDKSFTPAQKAAATVLPHLGIYYAGTSDKNLLVFVGPEASAPSGVAWLTLLSAPAGFSGALTRQQMPAYDGGIQARLDGIHGWFRSVFASAPAGIYSAKLEHNGSTLYATWTLTNGQIADRKVDLTATAPTGTPPPAINPPTLIPFPAQTVRAGDVFTLAIALSHIQLAAGQQVVGLDLLGAPTGMNFASNGNDTIVQWAVPNTYVPGLISFGIRVTQSDGQTADFAIALTVQSAPFYVMVGPDNGSVDVIRLGPSFTTDTKLAIEKIAGSAAFTDLPLTAMEEFGTGAIDGRTFAARYRGRKLLAPATYVFTFVQSGVTQYAILEVSGPITATSGLSLSNTKPTVSASRYLKLSQNSVAEGSQMFAELYQSVGGLPDTPVSGAQYGADNASAGTLINPATGQVTVALNTITGDNYTLNIWAKLGGQVVATANVNITDTSVSSSATQQILAIQTKRTGTVGGTQNAIDIRVKTATGYAPLFAYSTSGYPAVSAMGVAGLPQSDRGNGYLYGGPLTHWPSSGPEYLVFGNLTSAGGVKQVLIADKSGVDADWVTQYDANYVAPAITSGTDPFGSGDPVYYTTDPQP